MSRSQVLMTEASLRGYCTVLFLKSRIQLIHHIEHVGIWADRFATETSSLDSRVVYFFPNLASKSNIRAEGRSRTRTTPDRLSRFVRGWAQP